MMRLASKMAFHGAMLSLVLAGCVSRKHLAIDASNRDEAGFPEDSLSPVLDGNGVEVVPGQQLDTVGEASAEVLLQPPVDGSSAVQDTGPVDLTDAPAPQDAAAGAGGTGGTTVASGGGGTVGPDGREMGVGGSIGEVGFGNGGAGAGMDAADAGVDIAIGTGGVDAAGGVAGSGSGGAGTGGVSAATGGAGGGTGGVSAGTGGTSAGTGGTSAGTGGTSAGTGGTSAGTGGTSAGTGGTSAGTGGTTVTCSVAPTVISNFESGQGDMVRQGARTGYWYVYFPGSDTSSTPPSGMSITPAFNNGAPIAVAAAPDASSCNQYALRSTGSGFTAAPNNYAGFGASFTPHVPYDKKSDAYDVSGYTGISFKMKSGSGTPPAVFFEMLTKENQPAAAGGTATNFSVDMYNTRGQMLYTPWTPNAISTTYQTITVPFGTLIPRWVPDATACPTPGTGVPKCQPPGFVPTDVLGFEISMFRDQGFPNPPGSTPGTYDLWIDDVAFTTDDSGLQTLTGFPLASPGGMGSCMLPVGPSAAAKFLVPAYNQWKAQFVSGNKVVRPENGNDTTSEAIANGMLIAVNMNDKTLFDSLNGYWKANATVGKLMTWCVPAGSGSCLGSAGSDTAADEDAAFALLQADKVFGGGSYKSDAMAMIADVWSKDIDSVTLLPKGGSSYTSPTGPGGTAITNPSYFAPANYAAFKAAGDANNWDGVITSVYNVIGGSLGGINGLFPGWCGSTCTVAASNGAATDTLFQYDAHRVPMRIGLDYCFNGTTAARTYAVKTTAFFSGNAAAGLNGTGRILDLYTLSGGAASGAAPKSASVIGSAGVGAMAAGISQTFVNDAYQTVFDLLTRGTLEPTNASGKPPYSYANATVGMLALLAMTGNFSH